MIAAYGVSRTLLIRLIRAKTATAGAVVYSIEMNSSAHPAEIRASRTFGTV